MTTTPVKLSSDSTVKNIKAIRGMNDYLPEQTIIWQHVEATLKKVLHRYAYNEIRLPIVEYTPLFMRAIGEVTDVVEKEMYTFEDRNGESLTLRPEGTAGCVRAGIENGLLYNQEQRLWYIGPMFRYERPQKGRYRQFHQIGIEVFGLSSAAVDAELIQLTARWWKELGIAPYLELHLNSIGSLEDRQRYRTELVAFLEQHKASLDEDCLRRMYTNPLRVLDSKNPEIQILLNQAPRLSDFLSEASKQHFIQLCTLLDNIGIRYVLDERLVRGLDYYNDTVFEWMTNELGSQGTVCGGGRYDRLVEQLGGKATPAVGFAMGMERLVLLVQSVKALESTPEVDVYVVTAQSEAQSYAQQVAEKIRDIAPQLVVFSSYSRANLKKQFAKADKMKSKLVLILGQDELNTRTVTVKNMGTGEQQTVDVDLVAELCLNIVT